MTCGEQQNHKDYITLKEYFNTKLDNVEKATFLASRALEARLESMNEFRNQIKDQAATFITRNELEAKLQAMEKGKRDNIALIIAVLGIVISIFSIIK
jgi:hypothetical protein